MTWLLSVSRPLLWGRHSAHPFPAAVYTFRVCMAAGCRGERGVEYSGLTVFFFRFCNGWNGALGLSARFKRDARTVNVRLDFEED